MNKKMNWKFSDLLAEKIEEHDAIVKCPYCNQSFDIHTGMIFLENKQIPNVNPGYGISHFEEIMAEKR